MNYLTSWFKPARPQTPYEKFTSRLKEVREKIPTLQSIRQNVPTLQREQKVFLLQSAGMITFGCLAGHMIATLTDLKCGWSKCEKEQASMRGIIIITGAIQRLIQSVNVFGDEEDNDIDGLRILSGSLDVLSGAAVGSIGGLPAMGAFAVYAVARNLFCIYALKE